MKFQIILLVAAAICFVSADDFEDYYPREEIVYVEPEPRPYSFAWSASRFYNGQPDREHKEERGQDGVTRGVFRYVDPRRKVQEVVYQADQSGFHVDASNLPQDTPVVANAKLQHQSLFDRIAADHARIARQRAIEKAARNEQEFRHQQYSQQRHF